MLVIGALGSTSPEWLDFHQQYNLQIANFWQPTPRNPRNIRFGDRWYFCRRNAGQIDGYGTFIAWRSMRIIDAWNMYAQGNGVENLANFIDAVNQASANNDHTEESIIGCIELQDLAYFQDPVIIQHANIRPLNSSFRYILETDPIEDFFIAENRDWEAPDIPFNPCDLNEARPFEMRNIRIRRNQANFRNALLAVYGANCAISGPQPKEVLDAAHIQPYVNASSNHRENGLLLRADLHRLFDRGVMTIDEELIVRFCDAFIDQNCSYKPFNGNRLVFSDDDDIATRPSQAALEYHRTQRFVG